MSTEKNYNSWTEYSNSEEYKNNEKRINEIKTQNKIDAESFFKSLSYENKLLCFMHVVNKIYQSEILDGGTYRYLLYDIMNFGSESYAMGMDFGLMELHNSIYTVDELEKSLSNLLEFLELKVDHKKFKNCMDILLYGYKSNFDFKNKQLELDFS